MKNEYSRRSFVKLAGGSLLVLGGVGTAGRLLPAGEWLRPPGGQDEGRLLELCMRCDRCRSACPQGAIRMLNFSEGIMKVRTPVLDFHHGWCDFCGRCSEVCPSKALQSVTAGSVRLGIAEIQQDNCIAWSAGGCRVCERACPEQAISIDDNGHPVIDARRCNGCGLCEKLCPSMVLRSYNGSGKRGVAVRALNGDEHNEDSK